MKCVICGKETKMSTTKICVAWKGKTPITISGLPAHVCECGEEYFDEEDVQIIEAISKGYTESSQEIPEYLNVHEVADYLRVSTQSVYNMLRDGRLRAQKIGREWRFNAEEIQRMLLPATTLSVASLEIAARGESLSANDIQAINEALEEDNEQ